MLEVLLTADQLLPISMMQDVVTVCICEYESTIDIAIMDARLIIGQRLGHQVTDSWNDAFFLA